MTLDLDALRTLGRGALRRVTQGQIVSENGTLHHHSDALPPAVTTTLQVLARHGFITLKRPQPEHPDWPLAELTIAGMHLLDRWNKQHVTAELAAVPAPTTGKTLPETAAPGPAS
jgi:hypothetical protein